jgi:hypothetical protein
MSEKESSQTLPRVHVEDQKDAYASDQAFRSEHHSRLGEDQAEPFRPCAIPRKSKTNTHHHLTILEITKTFKGAFYSPFLRAHAPALQSRGISRDDFVTFIDGLNECFIAHPVFRAANIVGQVLTLAYGAQPVQWAGMGLQLASGVISAATSYARTRAFIKAMNADLFHDAGLHVHILTTKKMLEKLGLPNDKIELPSLEQGDDAPVMRRLKALEGHISPLDLDVPVAVQPDGLFRKMGAAQATKSSQKQNDKLEKRREKVDKKHDRIERKQSRGDAKAEKLRDMQAENAAAMEAQLATASSDAEAARIRKSFEQDEAKLDRKLERKVSKTERRVEKRTKKYSGDWRRWIRRRTRQQTKSGGSWSFLGLKRMGTRRTVILIRCQARRRTMNLRRRIKQAVRVVPSRKVALAQAKKTRAQSVLKKTSPAERVANLRKHSPSQTKLLTPITSVSFLIPFASSTSCSRQRLAHLQAAQQLPCFSATPGRYISAKPPPNCSLIPRQHTSQPCVRACMQNASHLLSA